MRFRFLWAILFVLPVAAGAQDSDERMAIEADLQAAQERLGEESFVSEEERAFLRQLLGEAESQGLVEQSARIRTLLMLAEHRVDSGRESSLPVLPGAIVFRDEELEEARRKKMAAQGGMYTSLSFGAASFALGLTMYAMGEGAYSDWRYSGETDESLRDRADFYLATSAVFTSAGFLGVGISLPLFLSASSDPGRYIPGRKARDAAYLPEYRRDSGFFAGGGTGGQVRAGDRAMDEKARQREINALLVNRDLLLSSLEGVEEKRKSYGKAAALSYTGGVTSFAAAAGLLFIGQSVFQDYNAAYYTEDAEELRRLVENLRSGAFVAMGLGAFGIGSGIYFSVSAPDTERIQKELRRIDYRLYTLRGF
ncbi:MAG: hypothetical protein K9L68_02900 [Spirochaetales bacterium]|nr:hypothetical protein [Spirochaetales bacterium]MCF7937526.1 hypothetical protein [Spirochaetales bacterium]